MFIIKHIFTLYSKQLFLLATSNIDEVMLDFDHKLPGSEPLHVGGAVVLVEGSHYGFLFPVAYLHRFELLWLQVPLRVDLLGEAH